MGKYSQLVSATSEADLRARGLCGDAIRFYKHPSVVNHTCSHGFGGFKCAGRRLVGVHAFLQGRYYPCFKATRKSSGRPHNQKAGQRAGSRADAQITKYIAQRWERSTPTSGGGKMRPAGAAANLLNYVVGTYSLDILDAHVLVFDPEWGVATEIDVLAQTRTGTPNLFVIENKTTLQTRAEHLHTYFVADRGFPILRGQLQAERNNEYTHHQLQLAVMVSMLRRNYGLTGHIEGAVLMRVKGGTVIRYPLEPRILALLEADMASRLVPVRLPYTMPTLYRPYVMLPPVALHDTLLQGLTKDGGVDPVAAAWQTRWLYYLQVTFPRAIVRYQFPCGVLPVHGQMGLRLTADALIEVPGQASTLVMIKLLLQEGPLKALLQRPGRIPKLLPNGSLHTLKSAYCLELGARWALCPTVGSARVVVMGPTELVSLAVPARFKAPFL